jgi:hypothetical protein
LQPTIVITDTDIISTVGKNQPFVKSEGDGAFIDMERNQFIENTEGLVRSIAKLSFFLESYISLGRYLSLLKTRRI